MFRLQIRTTWGGKWDECDYAMAVSIDLGPQFAVVKIIPGLFELECHSPKGRSVATHTPLIIISKNDLQASGLGNAISSINNFRYRINPLSMHLASVYCG